MASRNVLNDLRFARRSEKAQLTQEASAGANLAAITDYLAKDTEFSDDPKVTYLSKKFQ